MIRKNSIFCIDDEVQVLRSINRSLRKTDFEVRTTTDFSELKKWISEGSPTIVISDFRMPELNGIEVLKWVQKSSPTSRRIILSGFADESAIHAALQDGSVHGYWVKPWDSESLIHALLREADLQKS